MSVLGRVREYTDTYTYIHTYIHTYVILANVERAKERESRETGGVQDKVRRPSLADAERSGDRPAAIRTAADGGTKKPVS